MFREQTSSECLREFTCTSCAESHLLTEQIQVRVSNINLELLCRPNMQTSAAESDSDMDVDDKSDDFQENNDHAWLD